MTDFDDLRFTMIQGLSATPRFQRRRSEATTFAS